MSNAIIIVDPFGPAFMIEMLAQDQGLAVLAISSSRLLSEQFHYVSDGHLRFEMEDVDALIAVARAENVIGVITGYETGVALTDYIASMLGLPGNDPATSHLRRIKSDMQQAIASAGLAHIPTYKVTNLDEVDALDLSQFTGTFIVKPEASAGSDNVSLCSSRGEMRASASRILGHTNILMGSNETCLIQPYIAARDCTVNAVSYNGRHWVTDIWKGQKRVTAHNRIIYDVEDLYTLKDDEARLAADYAMKVLDAIGIRYGASHTELKLTSNGPVLMETGARISGAVNTAALDACLGENQISVLLDSTVQGSDWQPSGLGINDQRKFGRRLYLRTEIGGEIEESHAEGLLAALPTYSSHRMKVRVGQTVEPTSDLQNAAGVVELVADEHSYLVRDYDLVQSSMSDLFTFKVS